MKMKTTNRFLLLLALASLFLASCSKDDEEVTPDQDPFASRIVVLDGTHGGTLLKMASRILKPTDQVNLFNPLSMADSLKIASSDAIYVVLDGRYLTDATLAATLKDMWQRFYATLSHKLILVYDGRTASPGLTAQVAGFYVSSGYYVRSFGPGLSSQLIEQEAMTDSQLEKTINEIREKRARGVSAMGTEEEMNQYSFVRSLRFNFYRASDVYGENDDDVITRGKDVEQMTEEQRRRSAYGDFIVKYTIYALEGYKDHSLLIEANGAGFTTNLLRWVRHTYTYKDQIEYFTDSAHTKNFVRAYNMSISVQGKSKIPRIVQALPSAENGSKTVSETRSAAIGFSVPSSGVPSGGISFNMSNSVAYDQPSFSTAPSYSTDADVHSYTQLWVTRPASEYWLEPDRLDTRSLYYWQSHPGPYIDVKTHHATLRNLDIPALFPITFRSFSPQVSLLTHIEEDEVTVETGVTAHLQDNMNSERTRGYVMRLSVEASERVKIIFSDDTIFWE